MLKRRYLEPKMYKRRKILLYFPLHSLLTSFYRIGEPVKVVQNDDVDS